MGAFAAPVQAGPGVIEPGGPIAAGPVLGGPDVVFATDSRDGFRIFRAVPGGTPRLVANLPRSSHKSAEHFLSVLDASPSATAVGESAAKFGFIQDRGSRRLDDIGSIEHKHLFDHLFAGPPDGPLRLFDEASRCPPFQPTPIGSGAAALAGDNLVWLDAGDGCGSTVEDEPYQLVEQSVTGPGSPRRVVAEVRGWQLRAAGRFAAVRSLVSSKILVFNLDSGQVVLSIAGRNVTDYDIQANGTLAWAKAKDDVRQVRAQAFWSSPADPERHRLPGVLADYSLRIAGGRVAFVRSFGKRRAKLWVTNLQGQGRPIAGLGGFGSVGFTLYDLDEARITWLELGRDELIRVRELGSNP
jgi:hypothetical protein